MCQGCVEDLDSKSTYLVFRAGPKEPTAMVLLYLHLKEARNALSNYLLPLHHPSHLGGGSQVLALADVRP